MTIIIDNKYQKDWYDSFVVLKCNEWWCFYLQYDRLYVILLINDNFELSQTDIFYSHRYFVFLQQIATTCQSN